VVAVGLANRHVCALWQSAWWCAIGQSVYCHRSGERVLAVVVVAVGGAVVVVCVVAAPLADALAVGVASRCVHVHWQSAWWCPLLAGRRAFGQSVHSSCARRDGTGAYGSTGSAARRRAVHVGVRGLGRLLVSVAGVPGGRWL
jgi:hypothetical protein